MSEAPTRKYRNVKLSDHEIDQLKTWYKYRVSAKEAATALDVSYQCAYIYYKGFESAGFTKVSLDEIISLDKEMTCA